MFLDDRFSSRPDRIPFDEEGCCGTSLHSNLGYYFPRSTPADRLRSLRSDLNSVDDSVIQGLVDKNIPVEVILKLARL